MALTGLNGRLKRLEVAYPKVQTPAQEEQALWRQRTVIIFYRPGETEAEAIERSGIDPQQWGKVQYKRWLWDDPPMPGPQWLYGPGAAEAERMTHALSHAHARLDAERKARRRVRHARSIATACGAFGSGTRPRCYSGDCPYVLRAVAGAPQHS